MEIEKVLETVFIKEFNTTAIILENRIVVALWGNKFMDKIECWEYINTYCKGWVQTSEAFKKAKINNEETGIKSDPIAPYDELYNTLEHYAINVRQRNFLKNLM